MPDLQKKVMLSLKPAALFVLLNLPAVYQLTNKFFGNTWNAAAMCPTPLGVVIHAAVFFLLSYALMKGSNVSKQEKVKHALTAALVFAILSSAQAFRFVAKFLPMVASPSGCPTTAGIFVHGVVFLAVMVGIMSIKNN